MICALLHVIILKLLFNNNLTLQCLINRNRWWPWQFYVWHSEPVTREMQRKRETTVILHRRHAFFETHCTPNIRGIWVYLYWIQGNIIYFVCPLLTLANVMKFEKLVHLVEDRYTEGTYLINWVKWSQCTFVLPMWITPSKEQPIYIVITDLIRSMGEDNTPSGCNPPLDVPPGCTPGYTPSPTLVNRQSVWILL